MTGQQTLTGKKGLIVSIANTDSIACGCAKAVRLSGADLAVTYRNKKAEPYAFPIAMELQSSITMPCDVEVPGQLEAVFQEIKER